jgi:DNA polymerase/3'-5' exonuclease PolX
MKEILITHKIGVVTGKSFKVTCEQDIFEQIGTEYIPPEKRNY